MEIICAKILDLYLYEVLQWTGIFLVIRVQCFFPWKSYGYNKTERHCSIFFSFWVIKIWISLLHIWVAPHIKKKAKKMANFFFTFAAFFRSWHFFTYPFVIFFSYFFDHSSHNWILYNFDMWLHYFISHLPQVSHFVRPDVRCEADDMDIRNYVHIKKVSVLL